MCAKPPMARTIILLFSLCALQRGLGAPPSTHSQPPTDHQCCENGRIRGLQGLTCKVLPHISDSHTCRIVQEQCCSAAIEEKVCNNSIRMAQGKKACKMVFIKGNLLETQLSKMCYDCCVLGLAAASQDLDCELQGLDLGRRCESVAKLCCSQNTTEEFEVTEKPQISSTARPTRRPDPCSVSKCSQLCVGNGRCACRDGYRLQRDGVHCEDVNECLTGRHHCVLGEICINTVGSFRCQRKTSCGTGYELRDDNSCQDINECTLGTHNCGPDFLCNNTEGSFRCYPKKKCTHGFIQDASGKCIDINECLAEASVCQRSQTCINTVGSYMCRGSSVTCGRGYHLNAHGTRCEDVDECHTGNVCGTHGCVNLMGTYRCECRTGFIFNSITKLCEDINECRHYPGRLCTHKCENTKGSYKCSCPIGFKLSSDGRNCDDVDECKAKPCSQECINVYGSYQCFCRHGYRLSDIDGTTCEDIDECTTGDHACSYRCTNTPGSFYCSCPSTGYTLAPNGHSCQDIDECAVGNHTCSVSESCINVNGGFRCLNLKCPANFRQATLGSRNDGPFSVRCIKACQPNDIACTRDYVHIITHSFLSLPTFRPFSEPEEIAFLRTSVAANPPPGATDVFFDILSSDDNLSFDVVKYFYEGRIMGVVRQVKPIIGPLDLVLEVSSDYITSEIISRRNIVIIHIFISEFWM